MWWEIWHEPCCKFTAESNSERIFKISISQSYERIARGTFFMDHSVVGHKMWIRCDWWGLGLLFVPWASCGLYWPLIYTFMNVWMIDLHWHWIWWKSDVKWGRTDHAAFRSIEQFVTCKLGLFESLRQPSCCHDVSNSTGDWQAVMWAGKGLQWMYVPSLTLFYFHCLLVILFCG